MPNRPVKQIMGDEGPNANERFVKEGLERGPRVLTRRPFAYPEEVKNNMEKNFFF